MSLDDEPPRLLDLHGGDAGAGEPFLRDALGAARDARPRGDQLGRVATRLSAVLGVDIAVPAPPPLGPPPPAPPPPAPLPPAAPAPLPPVPLAPLPPVPLPPAPLGSAAAWWAAPGVKIGAVLLVASGAGVTSQLAFHDAGPAAMTSTTASTMAAPSRRPATEPASVDASEVPEPAAPSARASLSPASTPASPAGPDVTAPPAGLAVAAPPAGPAVAAPAGPLTPAPTASASPPAPHAESETDLLRRAQSLLGADPVAALQLTEDHRRSHPSGALIEEREVIAVAALMKLGRKVEAETRAAGFRARFPGSAYLRRLDVVLGTAPEDQKSEPPAPIQP